MITCRNLGADGPETFAGTIVEVTSDTRYTQSARYAGPIYRRDLVRIVLRDGPDTRRALGKHFGATDANAVNVAFLFSTKNEAAYVHTANALIAVYEAAFGKEAAWDFRCALRGEPEREDFRENVHGNLVHVYSPAREPLTDLNEVPLDMLQELCGLRFIVDAALVPVLPPPRPGDSDAVDAVSVALASHKAVFRTVFTWTRSS